jgi:Uma2 family endonuclease
MATVSSRVDRPAVDYPTSDGRPMAETEDHRDLLFDSIYTLKMHPRTARQFYVSGNLLMYYEEGNKRKHVSPDVFAVRGISKRRRKYYLVWEEAKAPDFILELTSKSTRREDLKEKFALYRDTLKVQEYFLFDPHQEYLKPQLQGYRLVHGDYEPIKPVSGRLPSEVLGLHLEAQGSVVRFYDPATGRWLPTPEQARQKEAAARKKEAAARRRAEAQRDQAETARLELATENERLRRELDALRGRPAE